MSECRNCHQYNATISENIRKFKNKGSMGLKPVLIFSMISAFVAPVTAVAFEPVSRGDKLVVACEILTIHAKSNAFSKIVGKMKFGNRLTAKNLAGLFELPDSDFSSLHLN